MSASISKAALIYLSYIFRQSTRSGQPAMAGISQYRCHIFRRAFCVEGEPRQEYLFSSRKNRNEEPLSISGRVGPGTVDQI